MVCGRLLKPGAQSGTSHSTIKPAYPVMTCTFPAADALCSTWRMKTDALRWRKQSGSDADMVLKGLSQ